MVNDAVLSRGLGHLVGDERRFDGARMLGVDEHVWRHAPRGGRYVTVAVNPTPRRDGRPARLLDMVEGRSGRAFADWLAARPESFRDNVQVVAMDAFAGYKRAAARQAPRAAEVLDPFHVVQLAGQKLTVFSQVGVSVFVGYFLRFWAWVCRPGVFIGFGVCRT